MSTLKADTIQSTGGGAVTLTKQFASKAWLSYKGTSTNSIYDSFNISSVDDDATGTYTVNFSSAFNGANDYALAGFAQGDTGGGGRSVDGRTTPTTTARPIETNRTFDNADIDCSHVQISVHGDLA